MRQTRKADRRRKKPRQWTSKVELDAAAAGVTLPPSEWGELPDWLVGGD